MASSSVSQESLDLEDFEQAQRRSRIRMLRASRGCTGVTHRTESFDHDDHNGDTNGDMMEHHTGAIGHTEPHDSPTRLGGLRAKDKRPGRPNHFPKGKTVKDKRKLREKRRSTGVVHLPSTESTGDSLDEGEEKTGETRRNTTYNEIIDADNPQTPEEDRLSKSYAARNIRNKSPSDLEADLEDNQDYDSTVSQSETNLTIIGTSSPQQPMSKFGRLRASPDTAMRSSLGMGGAYASGHTEEVSSRPVSYPSRFKEHDLELEGNRSILGHRMKGHTEHPARMHLIRTRSDGNGAKVMPDSPVDSKLLARNRELERMLELERVENRKLQHALDERDSRIAQLERELSLLNQDLIMVDEEYGKLQQENRVILQAMTRLNIQ